MCYEYSVSNQRSFRPPSRSTARPNQVLNSLLICDSEIVPLKKSKSTSAKYF